MTGAQQIIQEGELRVEGRFVDASNATLFAKCFDGVNEVAVIYKPIAGERPLWDFPDGNLANRELGTYLLSEALDLHLVPFTIIREGPFGPGMVQEWIEINEEIDIVELAQGRDQRVREMALFDAVINNTDRKFGHILPSVAGELFGCDHGVTFHEEPKLRTVIWQFSGEVFSQEDLSLLQSAAKIAPTVLQGLVTELEIAALLARINELLTRGRFPEPNSDWPAVPWPPF